MGTFYPKYIDVVLVSAESYTLIPLVSNLSNLVPRTPLEYLQQPFHHLYDVLLSYRCFSHFSQLWR